MTWRFPGGYGVLDGAEANLFRASLASVYDMMLEEAELDMDPWKFGIPVFDRLAWPQRLALLVEVGEAVLLPNVPTPELTAIREGAVAAVAENVCVQLDIEIDEGRDNVRESGPRYYWRRLVRDIWSECDDLSPEITVPEETSEDRDEWRELAEDGFSAAVLWDDDWSDESFDDLEPEAARILKEQADIPQGYYTDIAPDPNRADIPGLIKRMSELIATVNGEGRLFDPGLMPKNLNFKD